MRARSRPLRRLIWRPPRLRLLLLLHDLRARPGRRERRLTHRDDATRGPRPPMGSRGSQRVERLRGYGRTRQGHGVLHIEEWLVGGCSGWRSRGAQSPVAIHELVKSPGVKDSLLLLFLLFLVGLLQRPSNLRVVLRLRPLNHRARILV